MNTIKNAIRRHKIAFVIIMALISLFVVFLFVSLLSGGTIIDAILGTVLTAALCVLPALVIALSVLEYKSYSDLLNTLYDIEKKPARKKKKRK